MQVNGFLKKSRLWIVFTPLAVFALLILVKFLTLAFKDAAPETEEPAVVERGSIVDRNGKPLAVQSVYYHFGVTPKMIKDREDFASIVAPYINISKDDLIANLEANNNSKFMYIQKNLQQDQYESLRSAINKSSYKNAVSFEHNAGRVYPENELASQLIGYMGTDSRGLSGIEYSQQALLQPVPDKNAKGTIFGNNIHLTIDANLQYKLEQISKRAMETTQAESLMLIAADSRSGEILSYISLPEANLNDYSSSSSMERLDRPAVTSYEPGSVFKIFSTAAFLDSRSITTSQQFVCDGIYQRTTNRGETIRITCLEHHGALTVRDALKYSCNDALAQMSESIGTDSFLQYIHDFGFGERTEVELPSETKGSVKDQNDRLWSARSKPTMSIGQEISVSALQMVQAATVLANQGRMVKLTFIKKITDKDGKDLENHTVTYGNQVLRSDTAKYILSCMETTTQSGTGSKAALGDISIGVKTGTAQMADPVKGGYSDTDFLSNCMAIFPVENPQIILYIVIQKAKGETYAGRIVAPVIAEAADEIIDHLGLTRSGAASLEHSGTVHIDDTEEIVITTKVPDFTGKSKRELLPLLEREDLSIQIKGEGWVVRQWPAAGSPVTENMSIELYLE